LTASAFVVAVVVVVVVVVVVPGRQRGHAS
jgi:hypothetical protein